MMTSGTSIRKRSLLVNPVHFCTDPVMHTLSKRRNGSTDKGQEGMDRFFATHECNGLCRRLGLNPEPPYHDN